MVEAPGLASIEAARERLHENIASSVLAVRSTRRVHGEDLPVLSNADSHSDASVYLAAGIAELLPTPAGVRVGRHRRRHRVRIRRTDVPR